ncbi:thioredoxin family protein [Luteibacter sp. NPDC031894]|uniref:thioredoxin family protein n=1 Tax=Luteibacter sp. NPDC031894 TaxID=3390572 RepID=UPI003D057354
MAELESVTDATFQEKVLNSELPVLVAIGAAWAEPWNKLKPVIKEIAVERAGTLTVLALDIDTNPDIAGTLQVRGVPTLFFFKQGKQVGTLVGSIEKSKINVLISRHLP